MSAQVVKSSPRKENQMADLGAVVAQLKAERAKLDKAIAVLSSLNGTSGNRTGSRKLSPDARAWAKVKAKKGWIVNPFSRTPRKLW
jgi:hypothetical protein